MAITDKNSCEVRIDGKWQLVPLVEAHANYRSAEKRCPVCHGRVNTQGSYSGQGAVTMAHRRVPEDTQAVHWHAEAAPAGLGLRCTLRAASHTDTLIWAQSAGKLFDRRRLAI